MLKGKVAIITGASQGMGLSIAKQFLKSEAIIAICDINEEKLIQVTKEFDSNLVYSKKVDVSNYEEVNLFVSEVKKRFGKIDILVNNAGILRSTRISDISLEEWHLVQNVNVNGVFHFIKEVIPYMSSQKYGRVVNIASIAGRSVSTQGGAHYTTSKAAVIGLTRAAAKELGVHNITVNAICPGLVDTPMGRGASTEGEIREFMKGFAIKRWCKPEEVADLALFLASEKAGYITGASIDINGGDLMI